VIDDGTFLKQTYDIDGERERMFFAASIQYASHPDHPWPRMRKEFPEKYESYVDLQPGVWTRMRIEVSSTTARLYVNGATQPNLIVPDLKHGRSEGGVAVWIGSGTEGFFSNLRITRR
jgi:hypothetical protein